MTSSEDQRPVDASITAPRPAVQPAEPDTRETALDSERFTERGEQAEAAAFRGEGAYSGGDFAGGTNQPD